MNRIQHDLVQGTDPWARFRLDHHGASEAASMLGLSLKMKRNELLHMKHTGLPREFSEWLQTHVLDYGHAVEAMARPHIEALVGTDLYPVTYSLGKLSASCDGLDLAGDIAMEHKQWSESLAARVQAGEMPEEHMPQCQQVMLVTGASRCLFVVSDGTPERMVWLWVDADPAWHQRLRDGWAQFDIDLAAYTLPDAVEPAPVGKAPDTLPALLIQVTGAVTASNLAEFKATALGAIRAVNRDLKTDADFADAKKAIKWFEEVESRLAAAKQHALSQTASIEELFRAMDDISSESREGRLSLSKLVTRREMERKEELVTAARRALDAHIAALLAELAPMRLPPVAADFAGCIKGLRSIASMQDALDTTLAGAKIAADGQARLVRHNVAHFKLVAAGSEFLFPDLGLMICKAPDDFAAVLAARIAKHQADEARRETERQAAEAQRIAAAEQRAREQEVQRQASEQRQREAEAAEAARAAATVPVPVPVPVTQLTLLSEPPPAPAPSHVAPTSLAPRAPATELPTLKLGQISERLGYVVTADLLARLGFVAHADRAAKLYREGDFRAICQALARHTLMVGAEVAQAA